MPCMMFMFHEHIESILGILITFVLLGANTMFSKSIAVIALLATPFNGSIGGVSAFDDAKLKGVDELQDPQAVLIKI